MGSPNYAPEPEKINFSLEKKKGRSLQMQVRILKKTSVGAEGGPVPHGKWACTPQKVSSESTTEERKTDFGGQNTHSQQKLKEASHQAW